MFLLWYKYIALIESIYAFSIVYHNMYHEQVFVSWSDCKTNQPTNLLLLEGGGEGYSLISGF